MDHKVSLRERDILNYLSVYQQASVGELSRKLNVSEVTIRRDLIRLDEEHKLSRFHGGARHLEKKPIDFSIGEFGEKALQMKAEKQRIGKRACDFIHDGDIVFMNSGTTVIQMLEQLERQHVTVVTNNAAATSCNIPSGVELLVLGGMFYPRTRSMGGEITTNSISSIYSNCTILGVNALDTVQGMTTSVFQETTVNNAMISNTRGNVIVLADHTKIGKISSYVSSPLSKINVIITDKDCPQSYVESFEKSNIQVIMV